MVKNTFVIGGEQKFAEKFIERLNKRFGEDLTLQMTSHKSWDQSGDKRESIPSGTDLTLVLKSNTNHSLRNWARKASFAVGVKFIECSHKVAIAELDIRHCFKIESGYNIEAQEKEEMDLYDKWREFVGDRGRFLPLPGMEDEGLFTGKDVYERMPWDKRGKAKMISKWDKLWISFSKEVSPEVRDTIRFLSATEGRKSSLGPLYSLNKGKSPYLKLLQVFKSFKKGSLGHSQVKMIADQWLRDAFLGTNFKDFSAKNNVAYALNLIFGVELDDMSEEILEIINEHFPKPGRPKSKKPVEVEVETVVMATGEELVAVKDESFTLGDVEIDNQGNVGYVDTPPVVEPQVEVLEESIQVEVLEEPVMGTISYLMLGDLKIIPNDTTLRLEEVHLPLSEIVISGDIHLSVDRIQNNTLYGVEIKKKGK